MPVNAFSLGRGSFYMKTRLIDTRGRRTPNRRPDRRFKWDK